MNTSIFNRFTWIAFAAGAVLAGGVSAVASAMGGMHHGMMGGAHDAADMSAHVDHVLKHLYVEIDATEAQKAQIGPMVTQAVNDLIPLHAQLQAARDQATRGLTQATVDRNALEAARQAHLQFADQASKRFVQLIGDVGEVLTPTQRIALADHLKKLHEMSH